MKYLCAKFGDPSCIVFFHIDIVRTNRHTPVKRQPSTWAITLIKKLLTYLLTYLYDLLFCILYTAVWPVLTQIKWPHIYTVVA